MWRSSALSNPGRHVHRQDESDQVAVRGDGQRTHTHKQPRSHGLAGVHRQDTNHPYNILYNKERKTVSLYKAECEMANLFLTE